MGDPARFRHFARLIAELYPDRSARIADVASGKGQLQAALRQIGYVNVTSWDNRKRNATGRRGYRFGRFYHQSVSEKYDLVIAMHPDEGTDESIAYAARVRVPFVVCPCCVLPSATTFGGRQGSFTDWKRHLIGFAKSRRMIVNHSRLEFRGRNEVLHGVPA